MTIFPLVKPNWREKYAFKSFLLKLVPYTQSAGLNQNEHFIVLVREQGSRVIAKEIYGPIIQVWGRIEKVSERHPVVQELKYTQSLDTLKNLPEER